MIIFTVIASIFAVLCPTWPHVKGRFPRRLSATFVRTASDFRWWAGVLIVMFAYLVIGEPLVPLRETPQLSPMPALTPASQSTPVGFSEQFALNLRHDFLSLPRPCVMKITAPQQLQHARGQLVGQAINSFVFNVDGYGHWIISPCVMIDQEEDEHPELYGHQVRPATPALWSSRRRNPRRFIVTGQDAPQALTAGRLRS